MILAGMSEAFRILFAEFDPIMGFSALGGSAL